MTEVAAAYEKLRDQLEAVSLPLHADDRRTLWVVDRLIGIAVTAAGSIELLLVGDRLQPASKIVRRHLQYGRWSIEEAGIQIGANRIALPAQPHFLSLAALIAVEFHRCGFSDPQSLPDAFRQVEPLIEVALRRTVLAEEHVVGLIGELICLEAMLDATPSLGFRSLVLDMWRGHSGGRDFVIGEVGIEVKTTQLLVSSHKFSGLHQVEAGAVGGAKELSVYLLSVGLGSGGSEGQSLSELVERILRRLAQGVQPEVEERTPLQTRFLAEVASYGQGSSLGYDHDSMAQDAIYTARLKMVFTPRLYDLADPSIRLLTREQLQRSHVSADDIQFRLELEASITPSNPVANWAQFVAELVRRALPLAG